MKKWKVNSKTFGVHYILMDNIDYEGMKILGGKWCLAKKRGNYYAQKRFDGKLVEMHRYFMQPKQGEYVDHINGNTLDNRRMNLRVCSNAANLRNGRLRINNRSGAAGVFQHKSNIWTAYIKVNYKRKHLGSFRTFQEALNARKQAERQYWSV